MGHPLRRKTPRHPKEFSDVWVNVITGFCVEWMGRQMAAFLFAGWFLPGAGR
jgi:hypothetical protein